MAPTSVRHRVQRDLRRLILLSGAAGSLTAGGCVSDNHPLGAGDLQFLADETPIYAADVLDEGGRPVLPRQSPYEKTIQLYMTSGDSADRGAYVDLQADPPIAFDFIPVDSTCVHLAGTFRCTAEEDGFATFMIRSESDWSGLAQIRVVGRNADTEAITVRPAGLPAEANNFTLVVEGVENQRVAARYDNLDCTLEPTPDNTFDKWDRPRVREGRVTATAPINAPTVVTHAPVIVQSLHPEVYVTLDPSCPEPRTSRLRVQLDATGNSPAFFFCFSDVGGDNVQIAFDSGALSGGPRTLQIDPEPRLLRVVTVDDTIVANEFSAFPVAVSAFDADLRKVAFNVDLRTSDSSVLVLPRATDGLPGEGADPLLVEARPVAPGTAEILITPELHATPVCTSQPITVTEF